jgi:hypothetical protein
MNQRFNAAQQLETADNLSTLWRGLFPDHQLPSRGQLLTWAAMVPEATAVYAFNRAANKVRREPMTADRLGRYISGIITNERAGRHTFVNAATSAN